MSAKRKQSEAKAKVASTLPDGKDVKKSKDEIPSKQRVLLEVLATAERAGTMRWVLQGFGDAIRKLEAEAGDDYQSKAAATVRDGRDAIEGYLYSFFRTLDARMKGRLIDLLISDLWHSTKAPGATDDGEVTREGDYDPQAVMGIRNAFTHLSWLCRRLAKEGGCLAEELPLYVSDLVKAVNEVAETQPELVRGIAEERIDWPILATRHYPKQSDFAKLADKIGLATKSAVQPIKRHTWKPDTPINRHILDMLVVETYGDRRPLTKESVPYYLDEVLMPLFEKWAKEDGGWEHYPEFSEIARNAAKRGKDGVQRSAIRNRVKKALEALAR